MENKISAIIPIYNTGKILNKTLKSIQNQSYTNFECLLIDDGSNDKVTRGICNNFSRKDKRFRYFYKKNEGIELTRLFGVHEALNELLIFSDHDDYYEKDAFLLLINAYKKYHADIVIANCYVKSALQKFTFFRSVIRPNVEQELFLKKGEFMKKYYINFFGINKFPVSTWGKLYKKELFENKIETFGYSFMDDIIINSQIFERANTFHFIPEKIYTHVYGGLSSKFNFEKVINGYNDIFPFRKNLLNKYNLSYTPCLIEFKNVVKQTLTKLLDNKCNSQDFERKIKIIKSLAIFNELKNSVNLNEDQYMKLIVKKEYKTLYGLVNKQNNSLKNRLKRIIKSFL